MNYSYLTSIIDATTKRPSIINEKSNFVVVTYWWGRGKQNNNLARPCVAFYEMLLKKGVSYFSSAVNTVIDSNPQSDLNKVVNELFSKFKIDKTGETFDNIVTSYAKKYLNMIYDYCDIPKDATEKDEVAMRKLSKKADKPPDYEYKDLTYIVRILKIVLREAFLINKAQIKGLYIINKTREKLLIKFMKDKSEMSEAEKKEILQQLKKLNNDKKNTQEKMKKMLKNKKIQYSKDYDFGKDFHNMSIYDILIKELQYKLPTTFETMIGRWEKQCIQSKCNYCSIEYPEFAVDGQYQLAINAKPLFIKKMLELCGTRAVLYIDGDMNIRKYPHIFDMQDVDFMARGWWVDPRSSWKLDKSIMFDPYLFETSGGTMWFAQTVESNRLILDWVAESAKSYQQGKADDRVLSLVFNTKKYLCNMKIIQLPIEYLWLSLDFDDRLMEHQYDYNKQNMESSIFIDHPECLTSEETAEGSGASDDRTPKFYSFLEELTPSSETFHEFILYPDKDVLSGMKAYFDFMRGVTYLNDGNEDLYKLGYVDQNKPENNEQPVYVISHKDKYGSKKYDNDEPETINDIVDINKKRGQDIKISKNVGSLKAYGYNVSVSPENKSIEITHEGKPDKYLIPVITRFLEEGYLVVYNPSHISGYNPRIYEKAMSQLNHLYKNIEFGFNPKIKGDRFSQFFKPKINTNQVMFFRPSFILIQFLRMNLFFDELSSKLENGSYAMVSRIRMAYVFPSNLGASQSKTTQNTVNTTKSNSKSGSHKSNSKSGSHKSKTRSQKMETKSKSRSGSQKSKSGSPTKTVGGCENNYFWKTINDYEKNLYGIYNN